MSYQVRSLLLNELSVRCNSNPSYSMRAFARFLSIDPGTLSKILNKKYTPGPRLIGRLCQQLSVPPKEIDRLKHSKVNVSKIKPDQISDFLFLEQDQFEVISNWYYLAILEILELDDFDSNPQWIARKLGLSVHQVKDAFLRLERIGILKWESGGWVDHSHGKTTNVGKMETSGAMRSLQKEILHKAIDALEDVDVKNRSQSSMTIAIDRSELPVVKELITEFRRKLSGYLSKQSKKNDVYQLSVSFYPLTNSSEES